MPSAVFEPAIPAIKWLQTSDRTVTGIRETLNYQSYINKSKSKIYPVLNSIWRKEYEWACNDAEFALNSALGGGLVAASHHRRFTSGESLR